MKSLDDMIRDILEPHKQDISKFISDMIVQELFFIITEEFQKELDIIITKDTAEKVFEKVKSFIDINKC